MCDSRFRLSFKHGLTGIVLLVASGQAIFGSAIGVSPAFGRPGDTVTVRGTGFDPNPANNVVNFGPNRAPVVSASPTQLTVQVPNGQPLGPTTVTVGGGNGPTFQTVSDNKSGGPPSRVAGCTGCSCQPCCTDSYSSPCPSTLSESSLGAPEGGGSGGSVDGSSGELYVSATDLSIPGRPGAASALQYSAQRHYRTAGAGSGNLGSKWDHSYFERLKPLPDGSVTHQNGTGRYDRYRRNNVSEFVAPAEMFTRLTRDTSGNYTLRYRDGTAKQFDSAGRISRISDRNGNSLEFSYDSVGRLAAVNDTMGRPIKYNYDGLNRLQQITDFIGRTVTYTYDSAGNLASVTGPAVTGTPNGNDFPAGKTTRYTYDSNQRLLTVTRPNEAASGPPVLQYTYDSSGRIIAQRYGGTNASGIAAGGVYRYTYTPLNPGIVSDNPNLLVMRTQQTDRNGNVTQYDYNRLGYPVVMRQFLRPTDPPAYVTTFTYNADGRLIEKVMPQGNTIRYSYDEGNPDRFQRGNLLRQTRLPDAGRGGDQTAITTAYSYEPVFNRMTSMTEPRGNDPSYVPQNGGIASPARYTTRYTYDTRGNVVGVDKPTVTLPDGTLQTIRTDYTYNQFGQMTSETDPEGNVTQYEYFPANDPGNSTGGYLRRKVTDAMTSPRRTEPSPPAVIVNEYSYDVVGNMTRKVDGRGNDTLYTYNQLNQVVATQSEAPYRHTTYTFFDANDNIVQKSTENKVATENDGKPVFTSGGNFATQAGSPGFFIDRYSYDILDRVVAQDLDASGSIPSRLVTQYRYDANENRIREILPAGNAMSSSYDERDLLLAMTRGADSAEASTTRYSYDLNGNRVEVVDGRGMATTARYDGYDRPTATIDAVGGQTTSRYDPAGNVMQQSSLGQPGGPSPSNNSGAGNVLLNRTAHLYDELNRPFQVDELPVNGTSFVASGVMTVRPPSVTTGPLNPGAISSRSIYDRNSRLVQEIEDDLAKTTYQYDGVNRRVLVTDAVGNTTATAYDATNNVVQTVETDLSQKPGVPSETFRSTYENDSMNRVTSSADNCRNTRRSAYDSRGNMTHSTDAKGDAAIGCSGVANAQGNSTRHFYDGSSRRVRTVEDLRVGGVGSGSIDGSNPFNPAGRIVTAMTYDGNGRITALTDSDGNTTSYTYDALNRRTSEIMPPPDNTKTTYVYDRNDNPITETDNNVSVLMQTYDRIDRLVQTAVSRGPGVIGTTANTYQYDGLSRVTRLTDDNDPSDPSSASTVTHAYDSLGRVVEETQNGQAVDSAWFAQSRRSGLTYPSGRALAYTYDALQRVQTIKDAGVVNNLAQYSYIGPSRVLERLHQNGTRLTYLNNAGTVDTGYDALRRVIARRDLRSDNSLIVGFGHSYDREDNKAYESKLHILTASELYRYDSTDRLTDFARGQINGSGTGIIGAPESTQAWTLDALGNWRLNVINGFNQARAVNVLNQYTQINGPGTSTDIVSYDKNGSVTKTTRQALSYEYDYRNRLRKVCRLTGTATNCASAGAVVVAVYSYDAQNRRTRKLVTNSGGLNGTTNFYYDGWQAIEGRDGAGSLQRQYVFGRDLDEPIVLDRAGAPRLFYHQNTLSSTIALSDPTANILEGYQYDAYGSPTVFAAGFVNVAGSASAVGNPFLYTGQRLDAETGLYYYKNRYFDSQLGRFLQRDPLGYVDGLSLYQYVQGQPTRLTDPLGLGGEEEIERNIARLQRELKEYTGEANAYERRQIETKIRQLQDNLARLQKKGPTKEFVDRTMDEIYKRTGKGPKGPTPPTTPPTGSTPPTPPKGPKPPTTPPRSGIGCGVGLAANVAGGYVGEKYFQWCRSSLFSQIESTLKSTESGTGCCVCKCKEPRPGSLAGFLDAGTLTGPPAETAEKCQKMCDAKRLATHGCVY